MSPLALGGAAGTWPAVVRDTLLGAVATKLVGTDSEIVSIYHRRLEHGYPTPSLVRDAVLAKALPWLQERGIWSRGRFGRCARAAGRLQRRSACDAHTPKPLADPSPTLTI